MDKVEQTQSAFAINALKKTAFFSILFIMVSCNDNFKEFSSLNSSVNIELLVLSEIEVVNVNENDSNNYIANREVISRQKLNDEEKKSLFDVISNKANYEELSKKCKYEPVYAILADGNVLATFDVEYCPAFEFHKNDGSTKLLQVVTDSFLKKEIENLINN